jgi:hypothetical protein
VIQYVYDEQAAREHVGIVEEDEPTLADALEYAISALGSEAVEYSMGLDSDHLEYSYVEENGVQRPRTQADLDAELARHNALISLLQQALDNARA